MSAIISFLENYVTPVVGKLLVGKNRFCNVIYYHDVVSGPGDSFDQTNINTFKTHMEYLISNGYETLLFSDLNHPEQLKFKKKRVLITFDDGWKSNYTEIFDYMQKKGIKYNIFLAVGKIGRDPNFLTWEMIDTMNKSGVVGFGVHSFSHVDMSKIRNVNTELEIEKANALFSSELGTMPEDFCYPYGYYSQESNLFLENKKCYKRIYTSKKMFSYEENGAIVFGRNGISDDHSMQMFRYKTKGYLNSYKAIESIFVKPMVSIKALLKKGVML